MGPLDLFWHLFNLFAVSLLFGGIATAGARWIWRRRFGTGPWRQQLLTVCGSAAAVTLAGLVAFGRDGRMATYGLMVLVVAAVLGWQGRRRP
jgi:uncharacterized membrane protein YeaQ/YmgE (transglycosylase-associated protein family)